MENCISNLGKKIKELGRSIVNFFGDKAYFGNFF